MADILLSVGMQVGSADSKEFINQLKSIVNGLNSAENVKAKVGVQIDPASISDIRKKVSEISDFMKTSLGSVRMDNSGISEFTTQLQQMRDAIQKMSGSNGLSTEIAKENALEAYRLSAQKAVSDLREAQSAIERINNEIARSGSKAPQSYLDANSQFLRDYINIASKLGEIENRIQSGSRSGISAEITKITSAIQSYNQLINQLGASTRQEYGLSAIQMPKYNLESFAQSASAINKENQAVEQLNQKYTEHAADVEKAAAAETQKAGASNTLSGALNKETAAAEASAGASEKDASTKEAQKAAYQDAVRVVNEYYAVMAKLRSLNINQVNPRDLALTGSGYVSESGKYAELAAQLNAATSAFNMLTSAESRSAMGAENAARLQELMASKAKEAALASEQAENKSAEAAERAAQKKAEAAEKAAQKEIEAAEKAAEAKAKAAEKEARDRTRMLTEIQGKIQQVDDMMRRTTQGTTNYRALEEMRNQYMELFNAIDSGSDKAGTARGKLDALNLSFKQLTGQVKTSSSSIQLFGGGLSMLYSRINYYLSLSNMIIQAVRSIKKMVQTTVELDTSLTQLQIVTGESNKTIQQYGITAAQTAQEIGGSTKDLIDSTTVFARLGYTLEESNMLSKYTNMLQNVGAIDASTAQNAITAIVKAFDIDVSQIGAVMDEMVKIGNNFPISVSEIAEGMNNAGSALHAAGNSFEQSVALLTAANTTVQNISKSSTGLRTITARIRGTKLELDELGESIETAKYQKALDILTKYRVQLTENGEFRSTYDILKDIAAVWGELSSMEQANIAEQLAGNRQQNVFYSIIEQFSEAEAAMSAMQESAGALEEAYDSYANNIQGHINTFKAAFDELSKNFVDGDFAKSIIDFGTKIINVLNGVVNLTNKLGGLKTIIIAVSGAIATVKLGNIATMLLRLQALIPSIGSAFKNLATSIKIFYNMSRSGSTALMDTAKAAEYSLIAAKTALAGITILATGLSMIMNAVERAREGRQEVYRQTIESAEQNFEESQSLYDLYEAYCVAKNGIDDTAESHAALASAADELSDHLKNECGVVANLTQGYKELTAEQLKEARREQAARLAAAQSSLMEAEKGSAGSYSIWTGYSDEERSQRIAEAISDVTGSWGALTLHSKSAEEQVEIIISAYQKLIDKRDELIAARGTNGLFEEHQEGILQSTLSAIEYLRPYVEAVENAERDLETIDGQINNVNNDTVASAKIAEDTLSARQKNIQRIKDSLRADEKGTQYKVGLEHWLDTLSDDELGRYVDAFNRGAKGTEEAEKFFHYFDLAKAFENGGRSAKLFEEIATAADEAGISVDEFLIKFGNFDSETAQSIRNLATLQDELKGAATSLEEYNKAVENEHGAVASQYGSAYQKFLEDWDAGKTGTKAVQAAVELFLSDDALRDFDYDLQKAGEFLASDFFQSIFNSENGDPGVNFANYIRENLDLFKGIAEITENEDGSFNFAYSSIKDLAYATGMAEDSIAAILDSLDAYGVQVMMSAEDTAKLADQLGLVKGHAASTGLEIQDIANKLAMSGHKSTEILQVLKSLESAGYIDLSGVQDQLTDIISSAGEFYQTPDEFQTPTIDVDISGVETGVSRAKELLDSVDGTHATTYVDTVYSSINADADGSTWHTGGGFSGRGGKFASGTTNAPGGPTLVNERGPELISENGRAYIAGGGRPTVVDLQSGAIVLNANDTRRALRGGHFKGIPIHAAAKGIGSAQAVILDDVVGGGLVCPKCGTINPSGRIKCIKCGALLTKSSLIKPPVATIPPVDTSGPGDGGSGGGGGGGSSEDKEKQKVDWIAIAINRVQRIVSKLQKAASNAFKKLDSRLESAKKVVEETTKEIGIMEAGYERYLKEAESVGLDPDLAAKVRDGTIDINEYDEDTRKKIQEYQQWYEKALDCRDAIDDLHQSIAQLYLDNFNNTQKDFEHRLGEIEHGANMIEKDISMAEAKGYLESAQFYEALSGNTSARISTLNDELAGLNQKFEEAMASGEIEEGSDAWYQMKEAIASVEEELGDANVQLAEYEKKTREINWSYFDYAQEKMDQITDEANFLINLMSSKDLFTDNGQFTDYGLATMGMHVVNYDTSMAKADEYASELKKVEADLAKDPYNKDLIARREELLKLQRESILSAESEKTAVKELVEQGIQKELDSLQELIDAYNESLDSAKDLYDYQKKVAEQTGEIADLEKQLAAYQGDTSQENRARIQKLQKQLREARTNLQDTEREKSIADQKKLLSDLYREYEEQLNKRLDDIDLLMEDMITIASENRDNIQDIVTAVGSKAGYTLTDDMLTVLGDEFSSYDGMFDHVTGIHVHLAQIHALVAAMAEKSGATKAYAKGGLIDYTGLAAVHGTPGNPEMVLSATDTERFLEAAALMRGASGLDDLSKYGSVGGNGFAGTIINGLSITIPIDHVQDYNDMIAQMQRDPKFDKLINTLTLDRVAGKSQLGKYGLRL